MLCQTVQRKRTKVKNQARQVTEYFARIPYSLFDARESREITPSMFLAMLWLYKWCDWSTGSVEKMCAERLCWATDDEVARRTFQEALHSLVEAGWIISHCPRRGSRPYRVDICNYVALSGAHKGKVLNPSDIKAWRKPRKGVRADNRAGSAQGVRADAAQGDGIINGVTNGEPSAPTMRESIENITRGSSGDFGSRDLDSDSPVYIGAKTETAKTPELVAKLIALERAELQNSLRWELERSVEKKRTVNFEQCFQSHRDSFNSLGLTLPEIVQIQKDALAAVLNPPPKPTPEIRIPVPVIPEQPAPPPLPDVSKDEVLDALRSNATGLSSAELVLKFYGIAYPNGNYNSRYYDAHSLIIAAIQKLRRRHHKIVSHGPSSLEKKWVLTE
jgi:hypothetical protein